MRPVLDPATDTHTSSQVRDAAPLTGFGQAATAVVDHLHAVSGALWLVARTAGEDQVVLAASASPLGIAAGTVLPWSDSLCASMVSGAGPRVAPRVADVPAYAATPVVRQGLLSSYVGIPLTMPDGRLFGTLCGFGPELGPAQAQALVEAGPLFELQARLLSTVLAAELTAVRTERALEFAERRVAAAPLDLPGWSALLTAEQRRCTPHATPASLVALEIGAGEARGAAERLGRVGRLLMARRRLGDAVARTGPTSYGVLCTETPEAVAQTVGTELVERLLEVGFSTWCGVAALDPRELDLQAAWARAVAAGQADQGLAPAPALCPG